MVESQPGKVVAFDPTVTLSNFSAATRDHLIFNENQLVLAKLQQTKPVKAIAFNRTTFDTFTEFDEYKNLSGQFVYIDGSFQALDTSGVPTLNVDRIQISFDQQVTTSKVIFWSGSTVSPGGHIEDDEFFFEYSFDNFTWFNAGALTVTEDFDDTIELFPGDSPPTGAFKYSVDIDSGNITGRYWRIRSDFETNYVSESGSNPDKTITVGDTTGFPSNGTILAGSLSGPDITITYTGKTSTTFTGANDGGGSLDATYTLAALNAFGNAVLEIQIIPTTDPILEHWNSDGSKAVTVAVEGQDYYHMAYDKSDDVYYALRFNDTLTGATIDPDDNFNADTGSSFDTSKWIESSINVYFQHSTASGTLQHKSAGGNGQLEGNYGVDDDFKADIELVSVDNLDSNNSYFTLEVKDYADGNQQAVIGLRGPYEPADLDTDSGTFVGATVVYSDTLGGSAQLQGFRIKPDKFDFEIAGGEVDYTFTYQAGTDKYLITASGISHPDATPGVKYTLMDSAEFTIANLSTPADGQAFNLTVFCAGVTTTGTATSGILLEFERVNTNGYLRYTDSNLSEVNTLMVGNVTTGRFRPQLFGSPGGASIDVSADNFDITGGTVFFPTPVFSVLTIDKNGNTVQVAGVSDSDGFAIKSFDVIRNPQVDYNRYLTPRSGIATNGALEGAGGEIYIKVDDTLYRYVKTALPLAQEDGSGATTTTTGEIPTTGIVNFAYNGYSKGGLSYIVFDSDLSGVFVRSIDNSTLLAVSFQAFLDVASTSFPFTWNVVDLATLYFVDTGSALKLYDLNETKAGFVNVTSDKQVLAAGTGETATITAQVLNVYGEPKSSKTMTFSVSAGDGAVSPATGCSDANGEDTTTYTVGSAVGTATITVSVSDITCTP